MCANSLENEKFDNYILLFQMQLQAVLNDITTSEDKLTTSFVNSLSDVNQLRDKLSFIMSENKDIAVAMDHVSTELNHCIENMQFIDSICQRINHVSDGIEKFNSLLANKEFVGELKHWKEMDGEIQKQFKMSVERDVYDEFSNTYS